MRFNNFLNWINFSSKIDYDLIIIINFPISIQNFTDVMQFFIVTIYK